MPHPSTAGQGLTPREDNSFISKYHKSIGMEGYCNGLRGMGASLLPPRSVICTERSTAPPYGSWLEWRGQICEPNRSSSSCLPPLMFGGWKATGYLRVGDPLRDFFLLQVFFEYAFCTERPEAQRQRAVQLLEAPWPLCCTLLRITSASSLAEGPFGELEEAQADRG